MQFSIDLTNETPIYWTRHMSSKHEWEFIDERCKELHEVGLIQSSSFDFVTTIIMPIKKDSVGLWTEKKVCREYMPLNLVTTQDSYPMPIPKKLFDNIGDSNIFIIVDLRQGVATLALGSRPRQGLARLRAKREAWESHLMLLGVQQSVREWTHSQVNSHFGSWSHKWTPEFS